MSVLRYLLVRAARVAVLPMHARIRRFLRNCQHPERVQTDLLLKTLQRQANTAFGRDHGFGNVRTVADFRKQVPVAPYERLMPYIERVKAGETDALLAVDTVRLFALTSGTTAARKFIPITDRYLADYKRAWGMWGLRAYRDHRPRDLALRPIIQMGGDPDEFRTASGVPCGNLSGYTALVQRRIARRQYVVPPQVGKITDPLARYYVAVRAALGKPVSLFTAANPSTLLTIARTLDSQREKLLKDLHDGTLNPELNLPNDIRLSLAGRWTPNPTAARALGAIAEKLGRLYPRDVWPEQTTLIGTWTGGSMGPYLRQLPKFYGQVPVRDLGLIASEGRFTIPFENDTPSGVLDIWGHFFEFIPETEIDSPQPVALMAHELELAKNYYLVPTTAAGLYRYHISDLIRVTGFVGRTPLVEFLGKGHRFSNLTGEKLSEHHVTQAMERAATASGYHPTAYGVAPVWDDAKPFYAVFVEEPDATEAVGNFLKVFDTELQQQNSEYEAKRQGGRLGALKAAVIPAGSWAAWDAERLAKSGGSPEQYKRPALVGELGFAERMTVRRWIAA